MAGKVDAQKHDPALKRDAEKACSPLAPRLSEGGWSVFQRTVKPSGSFGTDGPDRRG
jgi:hypothetical protein